MTTLVIKAVAIMAVITVCYLMVFHGILMLIAHASTYDVVFAGPFGIIAGVYGLFKIIKKLAK